MYSLIYGVYVILALIQVLVYVSNAKRLKGVSIWVATLLALFDLVLLVIPEVSLVQYIAGLGLPDTLMIYLSSALYRSSPWGVATYAVLLTLPFMLARPWTWGISQKKGPAATKKKGAQ